MPTRYHRSPSGAQHKAHGELSSGIARAWCSILVPSTSGCGTRRGHARRYERGGATRMLMHRAL
eukprot:98456-Alexandrium_andersonii.AAC.1